jgi:xanthine dehydrogenase YagS FAD-binding subunit
MNKFAYRKAASPHEASELLAEDPDSRLLAGGTDLLPLMKEGIASPSALIDISAWRDGTRIEQTESGLRIGAMSTLASIAAHDVVRSRYTALADACGQAAAPQLRNMGTIGGNLLQETRCWYYRGPFDCWLKGGERCFARDGENEQHAIFHTTPIESGCVSAHPSDPAAALLALGAEIEYISSGIEGRMTVEELYCLPTAQNRSILTLPDGAVITCILLPNGSADRKSIYRKAMPRAAWAFALAGVAIMLEADGDVIEAVRVGLSGVAPIPVRAHEIEGLISGQKLRDLDLDKVANLLTANAEPLSQNRYKIDLLQGLFRQTFLEIARQDG